MYYGRWENGCGQSDEDSVKVNVTPATSIIVQPSTIIANTSDSIAFIVDAKGGNLTYQWKFNGENIESADNDTLIINPVRLESEGFYTVKINGTCGDLFSRQVFMYVSGTAIDENDIVKVSVFPNPTNGIITIELPNLVANTSLKLISVSGKVVMTKKITLKTSQFDFSNFSKGSYILEIKNSEYKVRKTILLK